MCTSCVFLKTISYLQKIQERKRLISWDIALFTVRQWSTARTRSYCFQFLWGNVFQFLLAFNLHILTGWQSLFYWKESCLKAVFHCTLLDFCLWGVFSVLSPQVIWLGKITQRMKTFETNTLNHHQVFSFLYSVWTFIDLLFYFKFADYSSPLGKKVAWVITIFFLLSVALFVVFVSNFEPSVEVTLWKRFRETGNVRFKLIKPEEMIR